MTVNDFTLQTTIERNKKFYLERFGQWTDEGTLLAIQDYFLCVGDLTDDDWHTIKENGLTQEQVISFLEEHTIQN